MIATIKIVEAGKLKYILVWLLAVFLSGIPVIIIWGLWYSSLDFFKLGENLATSAADPDLTERFQAMVTITPILGAFFGLLVLVIIYKKFKSINKRKVIPWIFFATVINYGRTAYDLHEINSDMGYDSSGMIISILTAVIIKSGGFLWYFYLRRNIEKVEYVKK